MIPIIPIIFLATITLIPLRFAANFSDGERTGILTCALAAIAAPCFSIFAFRLTAGGFPGVALAFLTGIIAYVFILGIPGRFIVRFSILTVALQLAVFGVLFSLGVNIGKVFPQ